MLASLKLRIFNQKHGEGWSAQVGPHLVVYASQKNKGRWGDRQTNTGTCV